jgi:hypothetical protein
VRNTASYLASIERQQNIKEARESRERQERDAVGAGRRETITLRRFRGEHIEEPQAKRGEREKPAIVRDGWDLARADFARKGHRAVVQAGDRYAELYRTAWGSGMKCNSEPMIRGTASNENDPKDLVARRHIANLNRNGLAGLKSFMDIVEQVCGKGSHLLAIAGDKNGIAVLKERLHGALSLAAVYWGME